MKKLSISCILLFIGICNINIYAQADQRQPVSVEIAKEETTQNSKSSFLDGSWAVKINPLIFFRGDIPIYVEKSLSDKFALELGLGFTHTDYLMSTTPWNEDFNLEESTISNEIGISGQVGIRYYASNYGFEPEGPYFGLEYRYQKYNSVLDSYNTYENIGQKLNRVNKDFRLSVGYINYIGENFFIEPYAGFGVRNRTIDYFSVDEAAQKVTLDPKTEIVPFLSLGFKLGILL